VRPLTLLVVVVTAGAGACHSEPVIPFPDAGDPCTDPSGNHAIDCARFPETTCGGGATTCPREIYGCADGGYFSQLDDSDCPPEAGGRDAALLGDVSLIREDDASAGQEASADGDGGDGEGE
jgi:hypothetical protein